MRPLLRSLLVVALLATGGFAPARAQDRGDAGGDSSQQTEESDEAFRRRMELEDARQRDPGYTPPPATYAEKQEKINKLPDESQDNIRQQLVELIVENGDWEPADALKEYPYEPTPAAHTDPALMQQEQEAWDEQVAKYNKREAAAYAALRGSPAGPGNPEAGEEGGGREGAEAEGSEAGSGRAGGGAGEQGESEDGEQGGSTAGTYQPYQSSHDRSEEAVSTAGVQQSALDFLKGRQARAAAGGAATQDPAQGTGQLAQEAPAQPAGQASESPAQPAAEPPAEQDASESAPADQDASAKQPAELDLSTPGIIAIRDLEKLEGADNPETAEEAEQP